ncbi:type I polyketide synthase [Micromonospora sonneratiae]|uniref:SDR family NAD(P)-dependent oxidoreductase n=1 Tax=Micromonospora sonneratiae TaxID=1184706 RepID=A0ABW3YHR0_9ACTN
MANDIVVLGMACRYAESQTPEQLWQNVLARRRTFRPVPARRLPLDEYGGEDADSTYLTRAAVLDGWEFDRHRFRIPGDVFRSVDLAHWLALEVADAALTDAGLPGGEGVDRSRVGVVLGNTLTGEFSRAATLRVRWPYVRRAVRDALADSGLDTTAQQAVLASVERRYKEPFPVPSDETLAGALSNTIAGRICNHFDFHGTGYTVDAACASSLVSVATAADAISNDTIDVALAGGVDLSLDPLELVGFARVGALAREDMRIYDRHPTGFLPGEGCGIVVLCRESYARERGLRPYARLLGWATSTDGGGGLTRPRLTGQRIALTRAYERAGIAASQVGLVEGHGTGTAVGDEVELSTLVAVRRGSGEPVTPAALGSVKANIGHTKAAAGVAGLIKAVLAVHREVVPPTTGCETPHPVLAGAADTLRITTEAQPWPTTQRYASVSAMGFGGINSHVVLGGYAPTSRRLLSPHERRIAAPYPEHEVVVCGADDAERLADLLDRIGVAASQLSRGELTDLAATLAAEHADAGPARFAAAVRSGPELAALARSTRDRLHAGDRRILDPDRGVFVNVDRPLSVGLLFSGQAAPVRPTAGALGCLLDRRSGAGAESRRPTSPVEGGDDAVADTSVAQPAIVRASLDGLRWLDALGVRADQATGHSLGELTALVWAGALDGEQARRLAAVRGTAMAAASTVPSGMAALNTDATTAGQLVAGTSAVVAADNGAEQVAVSGSRSDVARVMADATARGIGVTWLPVSHGFHSPLMAAAREPLRTAADAVSWRAPRRTVVSTVTGDRWDGDGPVELLVRQLTEPVRFRQALSRIDADLLVEVGPGRILAGLATAAGRTAVSLDVGAVDDRAVALVTAALWGVGACPSVAPYFDGRFSRHFDLTRQRLFLTNPCELIARSTGSDPRPTAPARIDEGVLEPVATPVAPQRPRPAATATGGGAGTGQLLEDPLELVRARIAAAAELDVAAVGADTRLMADLHLNSLRVAQLAGTLARETGRALPAAPLTLAGATVSEFASAIAALPPTSDESGPPAGVGPWVHTFGHHLVARPAGPGPVAQHRWEIVGPLDRHPLRDRITAAFPTGDADRRLLVLPPDPVDVPVDDIVTALRRTASDRRPLVVLHHQGVGAAVGRSLAVEFPEIPVLVVECVADDEGVRLAGREAHHSWTGYREVRYGADAVRTVPVTRRIDIAARPDDQLPLSTGDVCVVTGGARGIGAACAVALARTTGARMVLLGRSPAGDDEVVDAVRATGGAYHSVDLTDPAGVAATLAAVRQRYGPIRGLLHAAGRNEPSRIVDLAATDLHATLAPKAAGLEHVLAALDRADLRIVVTFGSVIGRTGLPGQTAYAIANEYLARRCAALVSEVPEVRWINVEWSAWAETGMGVRLGVLDNLIRQGLTPIPVAAGTDLLLRVMATPALPSSVLVAGRLPVTPTLEWEDGESVGSRFLEHRSVHTPGVELVAEAHLSLGTDPYLADHRIDGVPVLPAVLGLEAMAQAATALGAKSVPASFRDIRLTRPITVPERGRRIVRVAALAGDDGNASVVVRSDETGFAADHFTACYDVAADPPPPARSGTPYPLIDAGPLYGPLFFHGPGFHRVRGYRGLSAYRCTALIDADPDAAWFGPFQDRRLELGDPGARDAFLHALQGCVPDRRVLPVGVDRVDIHRRPEGIVALDAVQRAEEEDEYLFDLTVTDAGGSVVEQWHGLRLRAVAPLPYPAWPAELVGPYLARSLRRWQPDVGIDLVSVPARRGDRALTRALAAWLVDAPVRHAANGRLVAKGPTGVSASHLDDHLLVAAGRGAVAVDWEPVGVPPPLPSPTQELVGLMTTVTGEDARTAGCRGWTALETSSKLGLPADAALVLDVTGPDGWLRLRCGPHQLFSTVVRTTGGPVAICVGTGERHG